MTQSSSRSEGCFTGVTEQEAVVVHGGAVGNQSEWKLKMEITVHNSGLLDFVITILELFGGVR